MGQLGRAAILGANAALAVLCVFFLSRIVTPVLAEWVDPPAGAAVAAPSPDSRQARTWSDRQVILERNLFHASTAEPAAPPPQEELEATALPLTLLGTAAAKRPARSLAVVLDSQRNEHVVVGLGDRLADRATVVRIEPGRIVLRNGRSLEELALEEDENGAAGSGSVSVSRNGRSSSLERVAARRRAAAAARRREQRADEGRTEREEALERLGSRIRQLSENRFAVPRSDVEEAATDPAALFSQARIVPRYEGEQMVGLQVNAIKPDSLFEQIGIENGDTVVEFNGIDVTSPEQSQALLRELTDSTRFDVVVQDRSGQERTLTYEVQE